ncbi:hypothetical protein TNCV_1430701 [Trichonephila clavipes]|nr:hypothetical protein TNCV_1430701 [Trichonephila clavipes]
MNFVGLGSDCVRQVAFETTTTQLRSGIMRFLIALEVSLDLAIASASVRGKLREISGLLGKVIHLLIANVIRYLLQSASSLAYNYSINKGNYTLGILPVWIARSADLEFENSKMPLELVN